MAVHEGPLDPTDQAILYLLQEDARTNTTEEIGEKVGVASSTVSTRIRRLEERGIVTGYHPIVDYERAGFDHHCLVIATAPHDRRGEFRDAALDVHGVVSVRELLTHRQNLSIDIVGRNRNRVEETFCELSDLGLDLVRTEMIRREVRQPFDSFGEEFVDD